MERVDLHIHSNLSDGDYEISDLVSRIKKEEINLFSITDHDSTKSIELLDDILDIEYVPGAEMSSVYKDVKMHILGYGITSFGKISKICEEIRTKRREIALEIITDLRNRGYFFDEKYLTRFYSDDSIVLSKVDISKMLVRINAAKSVDEAFNQILGIYSVGPKIRRSAEEIICSIKEDGGISVIAHPSEITKKQKVSALKVINELLPLGIDGIEVFNPKNDEEERKTFLDFAKKENLIITGGSDYHGDFTKPNINLCDGVVGELISERVKKKSIKH